MKKFLIGVSLLFQTMEIFAMESGLVSRDFFEQGAAAFNHALQATIRDVTEGRTTVDNAVALISGEHQNQVETTKAHLNQEYLNQIEAYKVEQEEIIRRLIEEKDQEIQDLQSRIDTILQSSRSSVDSLRIFDRERQQAAANVRRTREEVGEISVPELVTQRQVEQTTRRFAEQLNRMEERIQRGQRNIQDAIEETQERYGDSIDVLVSNLDERYREIIDRIAEQFTERRRHIEEAYEQQHGLMQRMNDELVAINLKLEKERELHSRVSRIFCNNPSLRPEKVVKRATDVERISDILEKHRLAKELYEKFNLFSDLYGNTELGVIATQQDLNEFSQYVRDCQVKVAVPDATPPALIRGVFSAPVNGTRAWNCVYGSDMQFLKNKYGMLEVAWYRFGKYYTGSDHAEIHCAAAYGNEGANIAYYNHYKDIENAERMQKYNDAKNAYARELDRAKSVAFPSESFNRLVDQFNEFVNRL